MPIRAHALLPIVALALLTTCRGREGTGPGAPLPADIAPVSGDHQTGTVGQGLALPLVAKVTSSTGAGVAGVTVTWQLTAVGGTLSGSSIPTDSLGRASVSVTLGTASGSNSTIVTASVAGLTGSPVTFTASTTAGPVSQLAAVAGSIQTGTVGQAVPESLVVVVGDLFGNPVNGAIVTWAVTAGGGSVSSTSVATDVMGRAAVAWTLGSQVGTQRVTAVVAGLVGPPLEFVATAHMEAAQIVLVSGNDQSGIVGTPLADPYVVRVTDAFGNPVAGVVINWGVTSGGGSIAPLGAFTNSAGLDSAIRTLGTVAGLTHDTATAAVPGLIGSPITFAATANPGPVSQVSVVSGDNQTGTVGLQVAESLVVQARDLYGNLVAGAPVGWSVTAGGGTLSAASAPTDGQGHSSVTWTLGDTAGPQGAAATFGSASGSPVPFVATALAGPPAALTFTQPPGITAAGAVMTPAVTVAIVDGFGNLVASATDQVGVALAANPAGGTLSGTTPVGAVNGVATFADLSIDQVGTGYSLQASSSGLPNVTSTTFNIMTSVSGSVVVSAGNGQTGLTGFALNVAPAVLVRDAANAPLPNAEVTFAVASGGGSVNGATTTTGANGIASVGSWTIQLGSNTLTATVTGSGFTGNPVTFTATGVNGSYQIEVRFLTPMSPARQAVFTNAAQRWESLIFGDVPNITLDAPAGDCASNSPALSEPIDDIVIFATIDSIDGPGGVLAEAGPCYIRTAGNLPILGAMFFDSADVAQLEQAGQFNEVILHEMGHVLGYGAIWTDLSLLPGSGGSDPHFTGPQAIAAFNRGGGQNYAAGAKVPVENCVGFPPGVCGEGTQDGHWRELVFVHELMTGFNDPGMNPLSVITTASMGDLGYVVNYAASDPYTVVNPVAVVGARSRPKLELKQDILRVPVVEVDAAGRVVRVHPPR